MDNLRPTKTEAIKRFLTKSTHADLAAAYNHDMEVQVNVAEDGGVEESGVTFTGHRWRGFRGPEGQLWKSFRIPFKANTEPEYEDEPMNFDLAEHVMGIGMTGWNWKEKVSQWVGFDFDGITGHAAAHTRKLSESELREVESAVSNLDWVSVRRSTSGTGLHLYVYTDNFPTANHTEHAALGRAILSHMSGVVGFDFQAKADACGGNMWIWHRKMSGTNGLELIKSGAIFRDIPANWRDHINVVSGKRSVNLPIFVEEAKQYQSDIERIFDEITGQRLNVPLDADHKKLIDFLNQNNCQAWWDSDHHMLVTHTYHLKEAHEALFLKGIFKTIATGTQRGSDHNCFMFPMRHGAWVVRRYTPGTTESEIWNQDTSGYTRCYFNRDPDLEVASRTHGGIEHPTGGFVFANAEQAEKAIVMLGGKIEVPNELCMRQTKLKQRDGKIAVEIAFESGVDSQKTIPGFFLDRRKWNKVVQVKNTQGEDADVINCDDSVRHIVTMKGDDAGWVIKSDNTWRTEPIKHVEHALTSTGLTLKVAKQVMGSSVLRPWTIVNKPFQSEYPGNRTWNRDAPQFAIPPSDERNPNAFPHWNKILNHLGHGLDEAILENGWAKINGIKTGADYLKCWIASIFQEPLQQLPYIFFYSAPQDTGKSTFHEAFDLLVTRGVAFADNALTNSNGFNGELANAILCVVEETNLHTSKLALNRIKAWVTGKSFPVHPKRGTPYSIPNSTHWVQFSNEIDACPVFPGDKRITMIVIEPIPLEELIPKRTLFEHLVKEASFFLRELLDIEIPPSNDRLNVPVIETAEKFSLQVSNETSLQTFLRENVHHVPGRMIAIAEMWERFYTWMDDHDRDNWSKIRMGKEMPSQYPKGRDPSDANWKYGNCSWEPRKLGDPVLADLIVQNERLVPLRKGKAQA